MSFERAWASDWHGRFWSRVALAAVAVCASCNLFGHSSDTGSPSGTGSPGDTSSQSHDTATIQSCEADLAAKWQQTPPVTGLGTAEARAAYATMLHNLLSNWHIPGAAVAVTKQGKLVAAFGVGMSDPDADQVAHPDDLWRLASLSKQITAVAVMHLVQDGQLSLDDHPFQILSNLQPLNGATENPDLASITVRELLQHRGGWNDNSEAVGDPMFHSQTISAAAGIAGPADTDTIIRYMLDKPLTYSPGSTYCYSNFGYAVLGAVIAKVSGMSYADYVQAHVLGPAGADEMLQGHTRLSDRADGEVFYEGYPNEPLTTSVFPDDTGLVPWEYGGFYLEAMAAHGAWIASPVDMERFAVTIDGKSSVADQLTIASETAMFADPHVPTCNADGSTTPEDPSYWYGFGLELNSADNHWHLGSLPGTTTEDVMASNGFTWSIFTNTRSATSGQPDRDIDQHGWDPIGSVSDWGTVDLFDQYPAWSGWMSQSAFDAAFQSNWSGGAYPTRLEARDGTNGLELRARFAPLPNGAAADIRYGLDCPSFVARDTTDSANGEALVSVQSYVDGQGVRRFQAVWATPY